MALSVADRAGRHLAGAALVSTQKPEMPETHRRELRAGCTRLLYNKWYVDEIYDVLFVNGLPRAGATRWARSTAASSTAGVNGAGWLTRFTSRVSMWWDTWIVDGAGATWRRVSS